jgi:hypothetical protein
MGRALLSPAASSGYSRLVPRGVAVAAAFMLAAVVAMTAAEAQTQTTRHKREQRAAEPAIPAVPIDKRDSVVAAPGTFNGKPYWLALAQCGGIYFKLNLLYTDAAVHARVVKPDPRANAEFTKKLTEAIKTATTYFDGAEHFLMTDRGLERADAVLTYDGQSRAAGERLKTVEAALAAAKVCPALYQACQEAFSKQCSEPLAPTG